MRRLISCFIADESGATAIEYGLIVALTVVAVLGALSLFGAAGNGVISSAMNAVATALSGG
jgi:pilus assembly protein Flp/PilA